MERKMSMQTHKELLFYNQKRYSEANWHDKGSLMSL